MKFGPENNLKQHIFFQLFFWTALFLFGMARSHGDYTDGISAEIIIYNFCHWIFQIAGANFIYSILILQFFDQKKYVRFSLYLLISLYIISVINRIFIVYLAEPFFIDEPQDSLFSIFTDMGYLLSYYTFPIISGAFIFISVMYMLRYKDEKENTTKLQKEKAELELRSLKSQLNPHFLFNTLNNIYSLSLSNSEKTSESISRLSDILDYILYKGPKSEVSIDEELAVIDHYIALESLRYSEGRLKISKTVNIKTAATIPPLLYLTLVENAFKHGAGKASGQTEIKIDISSDDPYSVFRIENTCEMDENNTSKGIGLQNIQRQLYHHYQNHFIFKVSKENNIFKVEIKTPSIL
ncbi:GHKL domain-containing protein [Chryseobacterium sp. 52]|uniref:sensor histidine kinase n=1 Tax=Chryseobacterium sp. 52 TaxID=2035213 RepID=UPI000C181D98|nr:sensor histidine kinase [Chryseobacterium sp. 52]PIF46525.1 GHKL domain-containing protein [Chryseobacterium sp. 52]